MTEPTVLTVWTIYDRPRDHPQGVLVRGWAIPARGPATPHPQGRRFASVDEARRELCGRGLYCIGRYAQDEPQIVESWI